MNPAWSSPYPPRPPYPQGYNNFPAQPYGSAPGFHPLPYQAGYSYASHGQNFPAQPAPYYPAQQQSQWTNNFAQAQAAWSSYYAAVEQDRQRQFYSQQTANYSQQLQNRAPTHQVQQNSPAEQPVQQIPSAEQHVQQSLPADQQVQPTRSAEQLVQPSSQAEQHDPETHPPSTPVQQGRHTYFRSSPPVPSTPAHPLPSDQPTPLPASVATTQLASPALSRSPEASPHRPSASVPAPALRTLPLVPAHPSLPPKPSFSLQTGRALSPTFSNLLHDLNMSHELPALLADVASMTVDRLKSTIRKMNEQLRLRMQLSGRKSELSDRVRNQVLILARMPDHTLFQSAKTIIHEAYGASSPAASTSSAHSGYASNYVPPPPPRYNIPSGSGANGHNYAGGGYNPSLANVKPAVGRAPLPPPQFGGQGGHGMPAAGGAAGGWDKAKIEEVPIRFRTSPFYRVDKSLSGITPLVRAAQGDRKLAYCSFGLTEVQRELLVQSKAAPTNAQYQVRLFCTSEDHFNQSRTSASQTPAPIDFPGTCEIKLNNVAVVANTRGIKKQAGTAPPVDLGKALSLAAGTINKVEIVYVNTDKRHFLVVYLVQVTSVKQVVDKIKKGKYRAKDEVIKSIIETNSDPDVVATALGLSLKDPLTFARIKTPIRSGVCNHIACFDAETFFMMNEQTPTWNCPICSKVLRVEDISVDGYFESILKTCPSSIEAVTVEPDGTWRSSDDKHGTGQPKTSTSTPVPVSDTVSKGKARATDQDAMTLDSDDDTPGNNKHAAAVGATTISLGSSPSPALATRSSEVIDLTLSDSDDDEEDEVVRRPTSAYVPPPVPSLGNGTPRSESVASGSGSGIARTGAGAVGGGGGGANGYAAYAAGEGGAMGATFREAMANSAAKKRALDEDVERLAAAHKRARENGPYGGHY